ncbi:MAG: hypothetical protein ACE5JI_10630 [Acidobacteriota bacterium]
MPVVHDRVDMASVVGAVLQELEPGSVAVELPTTLAEMILKAVRRLPKISLLISEPPGEDALVWACAPGEPFAEALRWAWTRDRPTYFIDPDVPYEERHRDAVPDPYALWSLGPQKYLELLVEQAEKARAGGVSDKDRFREAGMAHFIQEARKRTPEGELLVLLGAAHIGPVGRCLSTPTARPLVRVRRSRSELRHLHPESLTALLSDPPVAHAVFEILREEGVPDDAELEPALSRKVSLIRHGLRVITGQKDEVSRDRPLHVARYAARHGSREGLGSRWHPDRAALQRVVWRVAAASYEQQTQEGLRAWQGKLYLDFARRYARLQGALVPGLFEWVVAARGVADDNLAWEVFDAARAYPWQSDRAELATVRVDGDELDLGTRKITFRKRFFRVKQRLIRVPVRERPDTDDPQKWIEAFDLSGLCSHRPEDIVIEDYAHFLQKKAVSILSAERKRTEPFTTSLLDGIDLRETVRNVHEDRIYVQELGRAPGEAGSVVVVFDRDRGGSRFPYCMTWLGEHEQESDMAFYSTDPSEQVVGPGIMRATYGGFMMTYPPRRLFDVWHDPDYRLAPEKAEVLLMAGIDYSQEKLIVHLARDPPSPAMTRYAARQAKRVVHIPIGSVSPTTLKKIRVVHLLAGHDKRAIAKDYIW